MATPNSQDFGIDGGLSNINPAELPAESLQKYKTLLEQSTQALEHRYDQPNWFKVAAGFAKPQLGGFTASLGSAAQALGENVELQREQQLPISKMKISIAQADMLLGQKQKQNEIYQDWRKSGKPMDAETYTRIMSLGDKTEVANAASKYYEGAEKGLNIKTTATKAMGQDPMLELGDYADFQLKQNPDQKLLQEKQNDFSQKVNASKPPQVDQAQWDAMSRYDKMTAASQYAAAQRDAGMSVEEKMRQQANSAPERLSLLRTVRQLALGEGIPDSKDANGNTINGQQQMGALLNKFGGNNPMEVFARALADGKGPELLRDIDVYARQAGMSEEAKNKFQVLVKTLAENQVNLRGSSLNPTDAYGQLQNMASPNIGNSQNALVTLVDLMGHAEKHNQEKYSYAKDAKKPYGQLETDVGYNGLRSKYAEEHARIATSNPLMNVPTWYDPSAGKVNKTSSTSSTQSRSNERMIGGKTWVRQSDGSWKAKE